MGCLWLLAAGLQPLIDSWKHVTLLSLPAPLVVLPFSHSPSPTWTYFASRFFLQPTLLVSLPSLLSSDHLSDLQGRAEGDPGVSWDFYSSSVLGKLSVGFPLPLPWLRDAGFPLGFTDSFQRQE